MFKNHPKGLLAASLSNMGERFGFYTMMAILVLFLEAKFGLSGSESGLIYSIFYALIYILALAGGDAHPDTDFLRRGRFFSFCAKPSEKPHDNRRK